MSQPDAEVSVLREGAEALQWAAQVLRNEQPRHGDFHGNFEVDERQQDISRLTALALLAEAASSVAPLLRGAFIRELGDGEGLALIAEWSRRAHTQLRLAKRALPASGARAQQLQALSQLFAEALGGGGSLQRRATA